MKRVIHLVHQFSEHLVSLCRLTAHIVAHALLAFTCDNVHGDGLCLAEAPAAAHALIILLVTVGGERNNMIAKLKVKSKSPDLRLDNQHSLFLADKLFKG